jgi:hypothetical protein
LHHFPPGDLRFAVILHPPTEIAIIAKIAVIAKIERQQQPAELSFKA